MVADCKNTDKDCTFASADCALTVGVPQVEHTAHASIGWRTIVGGPFDGTTWCCSEQLSVNVSGNYCGGSNDIYYPAIYAKSPIIEGLSTDFRNVSMNYDNVVFDYENHAIIIKNIHGKMGLNSTDKSNDFTAFVISVTHEPNEMSEEELDLEENYLKNIIWESKAILNNGKISMTNHLNPSHFTFSGNENKGASSNVAVNIDEIMIPVDASINLDDLTINVGVDAGNLGYGISRKFEIKNVDSKLIIGELHIFNETFDLINYPNPVKDELKVHINLKEDTEASVILFDSEGNAIHTLFEGKIEQNKQLELIYDVEALKRQSVYFIKLFTHNRTLVKKVLTE
ncbi:T9SS type A sorting domain-containing protein [Fulvivirgaceae bacterium BMA10]|uniref:T9SS type A sorting domain-containing protein n=1 Tax=Splendidivirga corallicola TaxID=3051826 RepID=A0ABT8KV69_9BACT|nr:T9SS type A sorting domain-containing protein [Fulvivirgaceae bacterium BMA10]